MWMVELGSENRFPFAPAIRTTVPKLAALPRGTPSGWMQRLAAPNRGGVRPPPRDPLRLDAASGGAWQIALAYGRNESGLHPHLVYQSRGSQASPAGPPPVWMQRLAALGRLHWHTAGMNPAYIRTSSTLRGGVTPPARPPPRLAAPSGSAR